jgi:hypothetical protein
MSTYFKTLRKKMKPTSIEIKVGPVKLSFSKEYVVNPKANSHERSQASVLGGLPRMVHGFTVQARIPTRIDATGMINCQYANRWAQDQGYHGVALVVIGSAGRVGWIFVVETSGSCSGCKCQGLLLAVSGGIVIGIGVCFATTT